MVISVDVDAAFFIDGCEEVVGEAVEVAALVLRWWAGKRFSGVLYCSNLSGARTSTAFWTVGCLWYGSGVFPMDSVIPA
jgi:hypothetical protein